MKIGFTSTIPSEVIYASGNIPVDLNNIFITSKDRQNLVHYAEEEGFPRNVCAWIKGLYSVTIQKTAVDKEIAVMEGDCSNTRSLMDVLKAKGIDTIPFTYPSDHDIEKLKISIKELMNDLGTNIKEVYEVKFRIDQVRNLVKQVDRMTCLDNQATGAENHYWLVNCSDFLGDYEAYEDSIRDFIEQASLRPSLRQSVRLAYLGVPPVFTDLYDVIEEYDARVVYNEIQHQFSMPFQTDDIYEQYYEYTYPYDIQWRLKFIQSELKSRNIDGVIHYVQSFCHRQIEDILIRENLDFPILTIEGENPVITDERTKIRLQSFIEMIKSKK